MTMRPFEMSWSVAYALASTVGSRVPGFVTQWPSFIVDVACAASVRSGNDSCQSTCESYVQPYSKPCASASWISSTRRLVRRIGQDGDAEAQSHVGFSFARSESGIIALQARSAKRDQRGGAESRDRGEGERDRRSAARR